MSYEHEEYYNDNFDSYYDNDRNKDLEIVDFKLSDDYKIINDFDILNERETIINLTMDNLYLSRDYTILALIYFKWDYVLIMEKWYDKPDFYMEEAGILQSSTSIKKLVNNKILSNNNECYICSTDRSSLSKEEYLSLSCNHYFCIDCWEEYLKEKFNYKIIAINTTCPQQECNCIITDTIIKTILEKQNSFLYDKYKNIIIKNFTEFNKSIKACTFPNCNGYIFCDKTTNIDVNCINCGNYFCFKCLKEPHQPCSCTIISKWNKLNNSEENNSKWLIINTKQCPNCKKHIEKNQGCNHMTCNKNVGGCGYEFCWICLKKYQGHKECIEKTTATIAIDNNLKKDFQLFNTLYEKYLTYKKSLPYFINLHNKVNEIRSNLYHFKNISLNDSNYLTQAVYVLVKSKYILINSFAFEYFLNSYSNLKNLYYFHQSILEQKQEELHSLLEISNSFDVILSIDDDEFFNINYSSLKNQICDLSKATNIFSKNLLSYIENHLICEINNKKLE